MKVLWNWYLNLTGMPYVCITLWVIGKTLIVVNMLPYLHLLPSQRITKHTTCRIPMLVNDCGFISKFVYAWYLFHSNSNINECEIFKGICICLCIHFVSHRITFSSCVVYWIRKMHTPKSTCTENRNPHHLFWLAAIYIHQILSLKTICHYIVSFFNSLEQSPNTGLIYLVK